MARKIKADPQAVRKLIREWERTGKITTSRATYRPTSKKQAVRQALAIEYGRERSRRSRRK